MAKTATKSAAKASAKMSVGKAEDMRAKTDDQLERPARIKEVRREIARIKTLQGQRSKGAQPAEAK